MPPFDRTLLSPKTSTYDPTSEVELPVAPSPETTPDLTYSNVMEALRNAHSAGDTDAAKRIAIIADKLSREPGIEPQVNPLPYMMKGFGTEVAEGIGGLTDIVHAGVEPVSEALGVPYADEPFMGSEYLKRKGEPYGLTYTDPRTIPEKMRPSTRFGRVTGGGMLFLAPTLVAMRLSKPKGLFGPIIEQFQQSPFRATAVEALTTTGAAFAGAIQEYFDPGAPWYGQMMTEVAGGILTPGQAILRTTGHIETGLTNIFRKFTQSGREDIAQKDIMRELESWGENVDQVMSQVGDADDLLQGLPPAFRAKSPTLIGLTRKYIKEFPHLEDSAKKQIEKTSIRLNGAARLAVELGDPQLIKGVAKARYMHFLTLTSARIRQAENAARVTAERVQPGEAISTGSRRVRETLESSLSDFRRAENDIWSVVPDDIDINAENISDTVLRYNELKETRLLEGELFPSPIENVLRKFKRVADQEAEIAAREANIQAGEIGGDLAAEAQAWRMAREGGEEIPEELERITSGDLKGLRSKALRWQRLMRSDDAPNWNMIDLLGEIADAALEDLSRVPGVDPQDLADARAFSLQGNNLFSRTIVQELMGFKSTGGPRIRPEETLIKGLPPSRKGVTAAATSEEIENAARLRELDHAQITRRTTMQEQDDFIRNLVNDPSIYNRETGRINDNALRAFRERNVEFLNRFPELRSQLRDAQVTETFLKRRNEAVKKARKKAESKSIINQLTGTEHPDKVIGEILRGPNPIQEYTRLANTAKRAGPEGLEGLRTATFEWIFDRALSKGELMDSEEVMRLLYMRPDKNSASIKDVMVSTGVMTQGHVNRLAHVMRLIRHVEKGLEMGRHIDEVIDDPNLLEDVIPRLIGANLAGSSAVAQNTGSSLLLAHSGSKWGTHYMNAIPVKFTKEIIVEALEDSSFFMGLLTKDPSNKIKRQLERQLEAFLWQTMFVSDFPDDEETRSSPKPNSESPELGVIYHKGGQIKEPPGFLKY